MTRTLIPACVVIPMLFLMPVAAAPSDVAIEGRLRVWHPLTLTFNGPSAGRPTTISIRSLTIGSRSGSPAQMAGNMSCRGSSMATARGAAAARAGGFGSHRTALETGSTGRRFGPGRASLSTWVPKLVCPSRSTALSGMLAIAARDPAAPGFLKWGRLKYAGGYYLKFQDGPYWIKGGTNEPENLLAYKGFDDTVPSHAFDAHADDWRPGDPDWGAGKGKALIGLLNYLSARTM